MFNIKTRCNGLKLSSVRTEDLSNSIYIFRTQPSPTRLASPITNEFYSVPTDKIEK